MMERRVTPGRTVPVQAVDRCGLPGAFTGGLTAAAGGIAASLIFAVAAALVGKSRDQN